MPHIPLQYLTVLFTLMIKLSSLLLANGSRLTARLPTSTNDFNFVFQTERMKSEGQGNLIFDNFLLFQISSPSLKFRFHTTATNAATLIRQTLEKLREVFSFNK